MGFRRWASCHGRLPARIGDSANDTYGLCSGCMGDDLFWQVQAVADMHAKSFESFVGLAAGPWPKNFEYDCLQLREVRKIPRGAPSRELAY